MSKTLLIFLILIGPFILFGQEDVIHIKIELKDSQTDQSIESANIVIINNQNDSKFRTTIASGDTLSLPYTKDGTWTVTGNSPNYKRLSKTITLEDFKRAVRKGKVVPLELYLEFDGQSTEIVDINAKYTPSVKFGSDTLSVSDFVLIDENHQVLLTYPQRLDKGSELIWLEKNEIKGRREVQGTALELITDFRKNIYLRCEKADFRITPDQSLYPNRVNSKELEGYTLPILDSLEEDRIYFSNYNSYYPAYDYFMVQKKDTVYTKIRHIVDDLMMEQYRAEYKWADVRTKLWAWDMEAETGIDREVWVGANVFTNSIYYDPPIGDMYRDGQDLYVFDFYQNNIVQYDAYDGSPVDSVGIQFHLKPRKTGWEQTIVQDPFTKKLYTYFDDAGYMEVAEVDPLLGELGPRYRLHYRYVENIQIHDGMVYYIYRPFESPQKKYLYFEDLNREKNEVSTDR